MNRIAEPIAAENWNIKFSLNAQRNRWFLQRLLADVAPHIDSQRPLRILDLGCGCGAGSLLLADIFPMAQVIGIDISEPNIAAGQRELETRQIDRVSFVCADYSRVRFPPEHFDLIVSDSVLHLIPNASRDILPKLTGELASGGYVVFSIPDNGFFNWLLWLVRCTLRLCRSTMTDRLILRVARLLHGKTTDDAFLRERINYMYMAPSLWFSRNLRGKLSGLGLVNVRDCGYPNSSPGQFHHRLGVYSKPATTGETAATRAG